MMRAWIPLVIATAALLNACTPLEDGGYYDSDGYYGPSQETYIYRDPYYGRQPIYAGDIYTDRWGVMRERRTGYEVHRLHRENEWLRHRNVEQRREIERLEREREWQRDRREDERRRHREEIEHRPAPVAPPPAYSPPVRPPHYQPPPKDRRREDRREEKRREERREERQREERREEKRREERREEKRKEERKEEKRKEERKEERKKDREEKKKGK